MERIRSRWLFLAGLGIGAATGWLALPSLLYERVDQPLAFNHALHVGGDVGLECDTCHRVADDARYVLLPTLAACRDCHSDVVGESESARRLTEDFIATGLEVRWLVYARQPDNAHFPHAVHVRLAAIGCEDCHGDHGATTSARPLERNRVSGYSRDLWGHAQTRWARARGDGMKMTDCTSCHRERGVRDSCLDCHK